jgi:capsular exopolysaccharide synthesis family protein
MAFAQLGSKTLLVDANLREPGLARLFQGAVSSMGLTEVLLGRTANLPLHRVIGPPHLALLTAGTPPPNPVDLLSGPQFERLVRDWSRTYEFVLIDTPATSLRSDGIVIANAVRNVVLVARRDKTKYSEIGDLKHRLEATGARIVGAVINDF